MANLDFTQEQVDALHNAGHISDQVYQQLSLQISAQDTPVGVGASTPAQPPAPSTPTPPDSVPGTQGPDTRTPGTGGALPLPQAQPMPAGGFSPPDQVPQNAPPTGKAGAPPAPTQATGIPSSPEQDASLQGVESVWGPGGVGKGSATGHVPQDDAPVMQYPLPNMPESTIPYKQIGRTEMSGLDQQQAAVADQARIAQEEADKTAGFRAQAVQDAADYKKQVAAANLEYQQSRDAGIAKYNSAVQDVLNTKIDPNKVWEDSGTGGRIMAAIAVALGGYAASMNGTSNQAMDIINKTIDRDIAAQEANLKTKEYGVNAQKNLLDQMRDNFKDDGVARVAAKDAALGLVQTQIANVMANYSGQTAKATAMGLIGQITQKRGEIQLQVGQAIDKQAQDNYIAKVTNVQTKNAEAMARANNKSPSSDQYIEAQIRGITDKPTQQKAAEQWQNVKNARDNMGMVDSLWKELSSNKMNILQGIGPYGSRFDGDVAALKAQLKNFYNQRGLTPIGDKELDDMMPHRMDAMMPSTLDRKYSNIQKLMYKNLDMSALTTAGIKIPQIGGNTALPPGAVTPTGTQQ